MCAFYSPSIFGTVANKESITSILTDPQVELHVHLDGAIRVETIIDVAK